MIESQILWEHHDTFLSEEEADIFEDACRQIWANRKTSLTYSRRLDDEEIDDESGQSLVRFRKKGNDVVAARPSHYIGLIRAGDKQYTLLPKIYKDENEIDIISQLLFQFRYAYNLKLPESPDVKTGFNSYEDLFTEVLINNYAIKTLSVINKYYFIAYQDISTNIQTVRGRINFSKHLRYNIGKGRQDRIFCDYEVYQEDNLLYRIIKYVTNVLLKRTRVFENQKILKSITMLLSEVTDQTCSYKDCLKVKLNYYQQPYALILDYCKMFLTFNMADTSASSYGIDYFLINTFDLYEKFIAGYLLNEWQGAKKVELKKTSYLASDHLGNIFRFENDILVTTLDSELVIVDAKYKILDLKNRENKYGISQSDIYQMISYAIKRGTSNVILLYPGELRQPHNFHDFEVKDHFNDQSILIRIVLLPMDTTNSDLINNLLDQAFSLPKTDKVIGSTTSDSIS